MQRVTLYSKSKTGYTSYTIHCTPYTVHYTQHIKHKTSQITSSPIHPHRLLLYCSRKMVAWWSRDWKHISNVKSWSLKHPAELIIAKSQVFGGYWLRKERLRTVKQRVINITRQYPSRISCSRTWHFDRTRILENLA